MSSTMSIQQRWRHNVSLVSNADWCNAPAVASNAGARRAVKDLLERNAHELDNVDPATLKTQRVARQQR